MSGTDVRLGAPDRGRLGWVAGTLPADPLTGAKTAGVVRTSCPLLTSAPTPRDPGQGLLHLPLFLGCVSQPPLFPRQRKWLGGRESGREREKELPPSPASPGSPQTQAGWEVAHLLPVPLGSAGPRGGAGRGELCPSRLWKGDVPLSPKKIYVFFSQAKLGWGFISVSVPRG